MRKLILIGIVLQVLIAIVFIISNKLGEEKIIRGSVENINVDYIYMDKDSTFSGDIDSLNLCK